MSKIRSTNLAIFHVFEIKSNLVKSFWPKSHEGKTTHAYGFEGNIWKYQPWTFKKEHAL